MTNDSPEQTGAGFAAAPGSAERTLETAIKCIEARIAMNATIEQQQSELKHYSAAETARARRLAYQNALSLLR
jgi:phage regulator Rha-like protein